MSIICAAVAIIGGLILMGPWIVESWNYIHSDACYYEEDLVD